MRPLWWFRGRRDPNRGNFIDNPSMCVSEEAWRAVNGFTEINLRVHYDAPDHVRFTDALDEAFADWSSSTIPPGPEPGTDAHRVQALADEELRAWDTFIAGLQAKNRRRVQR